MKAAFDSIADHYDVDFTQTEVGKLQRNQVWRYLDKYLGENLSILEVNCGTGEDAVYLANKGHKVIATDISERMIEQAMVKSSDVEFKQIDMLKIGQFNQKFDVVFSNFGGLNCLSPDQLHEFLKLTPKVLKPGGRLIAVVMPKFCFMESLYYMLKLQFKTAFRRSTNIPLNVRLNGNSIPIWYYNPSDIDNGTLPGRRNGLKGIGILVPPSYLNEGFKKYPVLLKFLDKLDRIKSKVSMTAYLADHYLIDIRFNK